MDGVTARDKKFIAALRERVRGTVREGDPVARYSTYRIGGPATVLLPAAPPDVAAALLLAHESGIPWFAVGLGSNILLPDAGLDALVIRVGKGLASSPMGNRGPWARGFRPRWPPAEQQKPGLPACTSLSACPGRWVEACI